VVGLPRQLRAYLEHRVATRQRKLEPALLLVLQKLFVDSGQKDAVAIDIAGLTKKDAVANAQADGDGDRRPRASTPLGLAMKDGIVKRTPAVSTMCSFILHHHTSRQIAV
jgi:hypothetical protein